jgi:lipid II:glycine glycyltransferase (peptidoglycan interpeptide bridge formation enzyme)
MLRIDGRGVVYGEVWYDEEPAARCGVDIVLYRQRETPLAAAGSMPFLSLVTDLTPDADRIMEQFGKDCRYKIRRAETKDGLRREFISDPESRVDEFCEFYDAFAAQKSHTPSDRRWLRAACAARQLVLAGAFKDGEALVWHAYVVAGKTAQLQYTGSCFRDRDNEYRAVVGRANRWLHWHDMLEFKAMGLQRYDWGGLFEDESAPERAGINRFKKEFGGREQRTYNGVLPVTLKGRIYLPLRDAWRRLRSV